MWYNLTLNGKIRERLAMNDKWKMSELQDAIWAKKYNFKGEENSDEWLDRVAGKNLRIRERILRRQFLFGGRILSNRGLPAKGIKVTYSNCYVLAPPTDSIWEEGKDDTIWATSGKMAKTYAYGGGVGISIRNLRPRGAEVHNNARTTTGAVSFMPLYSLTTETIGQEGRRGALMLSIPSSHPDLEEFIDVKTENGAITGANISIEIDDAFMFAVMNEQEYLLHFIVKDTGQVITKRVDAIALYKKIVANNWDWAEPGMLFWDRISNYHLMSHDPRFEFVGTNPCAEEPLPAGGSCLLGSINLSEFVRNPFTDESYFDMEAFLIVVRDSVTALNEVLDEGLELHPLKEQRQSVRELRQIGLGVMGIADMLIMMGITYGDKQSLQLSDWIASEMANTAMQQSALLASLLGTFDWYDWENINQSEYFNTVANNETREYVQRFGLRNSQILCIAPTGSLSTMLGISGGIEPFFSLGYNRTTKSLHGEDVTYKVEEPIVEKYRQATGNLDGELPEYFVTAMTLHWKDRINMQSVWQKYIDASISSTVNLPHDISIAETMDLYMYAWEKGLKGATIFRDRCKRMGILTLDSVPETKEEETGSIQDTRATGYYSTCPECESEQMVVSNGCVVCKDCGFSPC
jgi:ribonucleoside-diphosphate reductase alpha chain